MVKIYTISHKDKVIYVGQTIKSLSERFNQHFSTAEKRPRACPKLYAKLNKYPHNEFNIQLIECSELGDERERFWIKELDTKLNGCNVADGGCVNRGMKKSKEQIMAQSTRMKNAYKKGNSLASWNGSSRQREFLSRLNKGRKITWGQAITEAKSHGPYKIFVDGKEYITKSINKLAVKLNLNTASMRLALWKQKIVHSKGHIVTVEKAT